MLLLLLLGHEVFQEGSSSSVDVIWCRHDVVGHSMCFSVCEEVAIALCNFVIGMEKQKMIAIECVSKLCQVLDAFHP